MNNCPTGLYCDATTSQCTADCSASIPCSSGQTCTNDGRCVGSTDSGTPDGSAPDSGVCGTVNLTTTRTTPSAVVVVDKSGSMNTDLNWCSGNAMCTPIDARMQCKRDFVVNNSDIRRCILPCTQSSQCADAALPGNGAGYTCVNGSCVMACNAANTNAMTGVNSDCAANPGAGAGYECSNHNGNSGYECIITRWNALQVSLVGPNGSPTPSGLISDMQDRVRFGVEFYDGIKNANSTCSLNATRVPNPLNQMTLNAYPSIKTTYSGQAPGGYTPTAAAIADARSSVMMSPAAPPPVLFILATDGQPNCTPQSADTPDVAGSLTQIQMTYSAGIPTYVIGLGGNDSGLNTTLQQFANVGQGLPASGGTNATVYKPTTRQALQSALQGIVGGAVSCDLTTNGSISNPGAGTVLLNGKALTYAVPATVTYGNPGDPSTANANGWTTSAGANGTTNIRLLGTACAELKATAGSTVTATFPCAAAACVEFCL